MNNYVDTREPKAEIDAFVGLGGWEPKQLEAGDFCFPETLSGSVGIERKEVSDLLASMFPRATPTNPDPRTLTKQLIGMSKIYTHKILLIEGFMSNTWDGQVKTATKMLPYPLTAVWNYLLEAQMLGIQVVMAPNAAQTVRQVLSIGKLFNKTKHTAFSDEPLVPQTLYNPLIAVLLTFPGVGLQKAESLALRYRNVDDLCNAGVSDMLRVPGVGRTLAERIHRGLHFDPQEVEVK